MKPSWVIGLSPLIFINLIDLTLGNHANQISQTNSTFRAKKPVSETHKRLNETQRFLLLEGDFMAHDSSLEKIDFSLLCSEGIPLLRENDVPKTCDPDAEKPEDGCPPSFWCHIGTNASTLNFCCPKNKKILNPCHLPPNSGFGTSKLVRYWYDWRAGKCRDFVYTSFGGNENNFLSKDACERKCTGTEPPAESILTSFNGNGNGIGKNKVELAPVYTSPTTMETSVKTPNPCVLSPDKGNKRKSNDKSILRWYYDVAAERCIQFRYFIYEGNENNFVNEPTCLETCGGGKLDISSCLYPMNIGHGEYAIPRFYYNAKTKSCKKFVYKGQNGNMNRFPSRSTCEKVCIKGTTKAAPKVTKISSTQNSTTLPSSPQPFTIPTNFLAKDICTPSTSTGITACNRPLK
uniref:BPTI/Kunitz inhibitor domain-containing protein n=1 Tax=Acrobeloides nanus TaxID=290746 RepID=A0A914E072_9BILA